MTHYNSPTDFEISSTEINSSVDLLQRKNQLVQSSNSSFYGEGITVDARVFSVSSPALYLLLKLKLWQGNHTSSSMRNQSSNPYHIDRSPVFHLRSRLELSEISGSQTHPFQAFKAIAQHPIKTNKPTRPLQIKILEKQRVASKNYHISTWEDLDELQKAVGVGWYVFFQSRCKDKIKSSRFVYLPWSENFENGH